MANFLLLPSFHFKIRLAAFQLVAETVVVVVASAAASVVARKRVANILPLRAALVANLVSALSSEDSCGGWRTAAAGVEWLHLCLAGWHRHQTVLTFLLAPSCSSSPSQGKGFSQVELFVPHGPCPRERGGQELAPGLALWASPDEFTSPRAVTMGRGCPSLPRALPSSHRFASSAAGRQAPME